MKLPKLIQSIFSSSAALGGGGGKTIQVPLLTTQTEIDSFVRDNGRVLLGYTARRCSDPRAYDPWAAAAGTLLTEMYEDPDRPKLAIAEVMQTGTGQEEPTEAQLVLNKGETVMTLLFVQQQVAGVDHIGTGWVRVKDGALMLAPAFGVPCPELPNSLVLQFQDSSDNKDTSQRRLKRVFFSPHTQDDAVQKIVQFCRTEYFRSDAFANFTQGLPIWATRNETLSLFGCRPSVSNVGALHIQANGTAWSKSLETMVERLARNQAASDIGVLVERIPDSSGFPSTILQYEREKEEPQQCTFPLESPQQFEELYNAIVQRNRDGVFDNVENDDDSATT